MEKLTSDLINRLRESETKQDIIDLIDNTHLDLKAKLLVKGTKFHDDNSNFSQDIVGGQRFFGLEDVTNARSYEEVNYIRTGLKRRWVSMIDDSERFDSIMNDIQDIMDKFD